MRMKYHAAHPFAGGNMRESVRKWCTYHDEPNHVRITAPMLSISRRRKRRVMRVMQSIIASMQMTTIGKIQTVSR
jgi:hypothetical protein